MTTFNHTATLPVAPARHQRRLAWRFLWRSTWPYAALCLALPLLLAMLFLTVPVALWGFIGCATMPIVVLARARSQLAALREQGIGLTEDMIAYSPVREIVSPFDPLSTFEQCADRLSSIGLAEALGYARPAAFRHNPFTGTITIGRVRPFWYEGAVRVTIDGVPTRVRIVRLPGLRRLYPQLGEGLNVVEQVAADLERTLRTRRAAVDAAVRAQDLERTALQARLHVLQAQVEPHFLYNTLANLKYLIRTDAEQAQTMVDHLVGYLQAALPDLRSASSTVGRELELAHHYLRLMQIRMGARLHFRIDADPALAEIPVPPAMLISLLENAVKHGLELATRPGAIVVACQRVERGIALSVSDDGAGLGDAATGDGVGLANIHQRLQLLYGARAALRVAPGVHGGVLATLSLPDQEQT